MDDAVLVGFLQGGADLHGAAHGRFHVFRRILVQRRAGHVFHDHKGHIFRFTGIKYGNDIRMVELGHGACLGQQIGLRLGVQLGCDQEFDRHNALEQGIVTLEHGPHAPTAQFPVQTITLIERLADHLSLLMHVKPAS